MNTSSIFKLFISIFISFLIFTTGANAWELQWYGQSAVKITTPGEKIILIDPFITGNPKTPEALKDLKKLGKIDLILLTHAHGDHIGDMASIAELSGAKVALNADMGHTLGTLGVLPYDQMIRFNKGGPIQPLPGITITMVHAEHSSDYLYTDAAGKKTVYPGGEPSGFIIELENGYKIYNAGDTGVFADMQFISDYYSPDLALLPIGGHFTMDPVHAAHAVKTYLKTANIIPVHYGTFSLLKGTPEEFKNALSSFPVNVIIMKPGEIKIFN
ncbi:MAG: metal-dependent hydrolase [Nitrospira sp.]|nr:metal-dependent hydrolase [bacterium]MBL7049816.1 metal-dependent hydrolase [Nitrospira sp.]